MDERGEVGVAAKTASFGISKRACATWNGKKRGLYVEGVKDRGNLKY